MTQETTSVESQASALREAANEIAHELPEIPCIHEHPMLTAAQAMGFASAIGTAAFVGRNASGDYLVQSSEGLLRVAPREIFEDVYVILAEDAPSSFSTSHEKSFSLDRNASFSGAEVLPS